MTTEKTITVSNRTENQNNRTEHNSTQKIYNKREENITAPTTTVTDKIMIAKNQLNRTVLTKTSHPNSILSDTSSSRTTIATAMIMKNRKIPKEIAANLSKQRKTAIIAKENKLESIRIHKHKDKDDCDDSDEDDDDDDHDGFGLGNVFGGKLRFDNILDALEDM